MRPSLASGPERVAEGGDRLLEAVVTNRDVTPAGRHQLVLGDHLTGMGCQMEQHAQVPVAPGHLLPVPPKPAGTSIELERTEGVDHPAW